MSFLEEYVPADDIEEVEKAAFSQFYETFGKTSYSRQNSVGHFTVSCWIYNQNHTKVLMAHHNLLKIWAWIGGHADDNENLIQVAKQETFEETGVSQIRLLFPTPIDLNILVSHGHYKKGQYVPRHLHYNVVYAFETDENFSIKIKPDENSAVDWINIEDIDKVCFGDDALPYYHRIIKKIKKLVDEQKKII